jgi:uncharacterized protein YprB with RNaseH-like and TPR domain
MAIPDEVRRRLEEANGRPLAGAAPDGHVMDVLRRRFGSRAQARSAQPEGVVYRRSAPSIARGAGSGRLAGLEHMTIEQAAPGEVIELPSRGAVYRVLRDVADSFPYARPIGEAFAGPEGDRALAGLGQAHASEPPPREAIAFADVETTGLGGAAVFLVGVMSWRDGGFAIRQYLARNYAEEAGVLECFADEVVGRSVLVTFNGKTFDLPTVRARGAMHRVEIGFGGLHLDLLHAARRAWRSTLPDCRLQTLEARVCGRLRSDDMPGAEVPEAFREFVRTGNAAEMGRVLSHNAEDLVTLADLLLRLADPGV